MIKHFRRNICNKGVIKLGTFYAGTCIKLSLQNGLQGYFSCNMHYETTFSFIKTYLIRLLRLLCEMIVIFAPSPCLENLF